MFGRYSHLLRAARDRRRGVQDTLLTQRLASLRSWNFARFVVSVPLTLGLLATVVSFVAAFLPGGAAEDVVGRVLALTTALTGGLSIVYLFLLRICGQLEIDILALLTLDSN